MGLVRSGGVLLGDILAGWDAIKSALPHLENEATVTVTGNPRATRRDLYFLAAATGFALAKRYDIAADLYLPPSVIMVEWDAAGNSVKFYIKYRTNLLTASAANPSAVGGLTIFTGPPETVYGAPWAYKGVLAAAPTLRSVLPTSVESLINKVPGAGVKNEIVVPRESRWVGRPILTREPSVPIDPDPSVPLPGFFGTVAAGVAGTAIPAANPRPAGDYRSRGSIYNMVYSALTTPQGAGYKLTPDPQLLPNNAAFTGL